MSLLKKSILIFIVVLINSGSSAYSQNITSRITILSGASVPFSFNSYTRLENGMSLASWTRLQIYYLDTLDDGSLNSSSQWHLLVRANSGNITGDEGGSMTLDKVELEVSSTDGNAVGSRVTLTSSDQEIVSNGSNPTNTATVTISYYVGNASGGTNTLLGESPDYYFVDLVFTLEKQ